MNTTKISNEQFDSWIRANTDKLPEHVVQSMALDTDEPDHIEVYLFEADKPIYEWLRAMGLKFDNETWEFPDVTVIPYLQALPKILFAEGDMGAPPIMCDTMNVATQDDQGDYNIAYIEILLDTIEVYLNNI